MSRKGRRARSKKMSARAEGAAVVRVEESPASLRGPRGRRSPRPSARTESEPPKLPNDTSEPAEPSVMPPVEPVAALPVESRTGETAAARPIHPESAADRPPEPEPAEPSVPPVGDLDARSIGDLDARFFVESSSEAWLAHELELRDPQLLRKMTANMARRRAHLARYVVGVVGVAVVLCLAALVKSAVPVARRHLSGPPRRADGNASGGRGRVARAPDSRAGRTRRRGRRRRRLAAASSPSASRTSRRRSPAFARRSSAHGTFPPIRHRATRVR